MKTEDMIKLPYANPPIFLSYHDIAFPLGVMQAHLGENFEKWVCTRTKEIYFTEWSDINQFDLSFHDIWGHFAGLTNEQSITLEEDLIEVMGIDLLPVLKEALRRGYYIHGAYNERYIRGKWAYQQADYDHDFLLIGCDNETFISVGYLADRSFHEFEISNQEMYDSLTTTRDGKLRLNFVRINENASAENDIREAVEELEKYLSSAKALFSNEPRKLSYGISSLEHLKKHFLREVHERNHLFADNRYCRILYEHKWCLERMTAYFAHGKNAELYRTAAQNNLKRTEQIRMLSLKMELTGKAAIVDQIARLIDDIIAEEIAYLPGFLDDLRTYSLPSSV